MQRTLGCVLAGGRSSRFGRDKAREPVGGVPLLAQVRAALLPHCAEVVVVAGDTTAYADLGFTGLADLQPGRGPLAGLEAALELAERRHGPRGRVLLAACDTLGWEPAWLAALGDTLQPFDTAAAFRDTDAPPEAKARGWEPLPSLYAVSALPAVRAALAADQRSLWQLLEDLGARALPRPAAWPERVVRIDRPCDLAAIRGSLAEHQTVAVRVLRRDGETSRARDDQLAVEEPLEIRVEHGPVGARRVLRLGVTLRSPGHDAELVTGLLWAEGIFRHVCDLTGVVVSGGEGQSALARLAPGVVVDGERATRHLVATASCGVCGRTSVDQALPAGQPHLHRTGQAVAWSVLSELPDRLRRSQPTFDATGGLHAAGLFDAAGQLRLCREDIGRHNALDKLVGALLQGGELPAHGGVLVLSGRIGFELVQKAAMAGIPLVLGVGAPTSLAVDLADRVGMTLVGFVRGGRGNVYTAGWRVV